MFSGVSSRYLLSGVSFDSQYTREVLLLGRTRYFSVPIKISFFIFVQCNPYKLNDNCHSVNTYSSCSYFLLENLYPQPKMESQNIEFKKHIEFLIKDDANAKEIL